MLLSLSGASLSDSAAVSIHGMTLLLNSSHLSSDPLNSALVLTSVRDREMKTKKHHWSGTHNPYVMCVWIKTKWFADSGLLCIQRDFFFLNDIATAVTGDVLWCQVLSCLTHLDVKSWNSDLIVSSSSFELEPKCLQSIAKPKELALPLQYFQMGL